MRLTTSIIDATEACDVAWIRTPVPNVRRSVIALNHAVKVCSAFL